MSKLVFGVGWQDVGRGDWGSVASSGFFLGYGTVSLAQRDNNGIVSYPYHTGIMIPSM